MNECYRLHRLHLQNFKLVDKATIDFKGYDLVVLDGPNGYGKTTIFDSIELSLTGKICRIAKNPIEVGSRGMSTSAYKKNEAKPLLIVAEFIDKKDSKNKQIIATFWDQKNKKVRNNKANNWKSFKRVFLEDFTDSYEIAEKGKPITNKDINKLFGLKNIQREFTVLNYIQQAEPLHFLHEKDKNRHELIHDLIEINKEKKEKDRITDLIKKINGEITNFNREIALLNEKSVQFQEQTNEHLAIPKQSYYSIINALGIKANTQLWDKEFKSFFKKEDKTKRIEEIRQIMSLVNQKDIFLKNYEIDQKLNDPLVIEYVIKGGFFINQYSNFKTINENRKLLEDSRKLLVKSKIITSFKKIDIEQVAKLLRISINTEAITILLGSIKNNKSNEKNLSKIIENLNTKRKELLELFKDKALKETTISPKNCLFCGTTFDDSSRLIKDIEQQTALLERLTDDTSQQITKEINQLYENHIDPLKQDIDNYLNDPQNELDKGFFKQLFIPENYKEKVQNFIAWCEQYEINIKNWWLNEKNLVVEPEDINQKKEALTQAIQEQKEPLDNFNEFKEIYNDLFQGKKINFDLISISKLEEKINYINYQYIQLNNSSLEENKQQIKNKEGSLKMMNDIIEKVKKIEKTYINTIKSHTEKIVQDLQIPFFIFSGRIIQEHERGNGLFLKTIKSSAKNGNALIFTSTPESDHDALYSLSSGQLSALVIALMLTLNKIYGNTGLNTLLIDDPVQTMDDINTASFVDVLRNDFRDRQHILSTHELDWSLYLRYKFKKQGLSIQRINVKEELVSI